MRVVARGYVAHGVVAGAFVAGALVANGVVADMVVEECADGRQLLPRQARSATRWVSSSSGLPRNSFRNSRPTALAPAADRSTSG
jgi:hypothetical protein